MPGGKIFLISSATVASGDTSASITFDNIPQSYTHLLIKFSARCNIADNLTHFYVYFNDDSTDANYTGHSVTSTSNTMSSVGTANSQIVRNTVVGASATSNAFSGGEIMIPNYSNTLRRKLINCFVAAPTVVVSSTYSHSAVRWDNTSAITKIFIDLVGTNAFTGNTRFDLYGIQTS
jgi:hypothetical protein